VLFVHRSRWDAAGVTRAVGAAVSATDKRQRSLEHKQSSIELVGVRGKMHVWLHFALAKLVTLASNVSFKLSSIHRLHRLKAWNSMPILRRVK
jgi:hypothetical protein